MFFLFLWGYTFGFEVQNLSSVVSVQAHRLWLLESHVLWFPACYLFTSPCWNLDAFAASIAKQLLCQRHRASGSLCALVPLRGSPGSCPQNWSHEQMGVQDGGQRTQSPLWAALPLPGSGSHTPVWLLSVCSALAWVSGLSHRTSSPLTELLVGPPLKAVEEPGSVSHQP